MFPPSQQCDKKGNGQMKICPPANKAEFAKITRTLRTLGWTVGERVAMRHRYGCSEKIHDTGIYFVTLPDGSQRQGAEATPTLAAMECSNITFEQGSR